MISGRGFGKTQKFNENSTRRCPIFDRPEQRLALYSSLITHFRHFWKILKNRCKNVPKSRAFLWTIEPLGPQGRVFFWFLRFFWWSERSLILLFCFNPFSSVWKSRLGTWAGNGCSQLPRSSLHRGTGRAEHHLNPEMGGPRGAYRQDSHSLLTPVGSADY